MKIIKKILKLNIKGGSANPAPPIGPMLGAVGVNIMDFCNKFNKETINKNNEILSIRVKVYEDNSYDYIIKKQTIKNIVLNKLNLKKGSKEPNKKKIGSLTLDEIFDIAKYKLSDLNCFKIKSAVSMIIGTLKTLGVEIKNNEK
ncbi:MAG: 50S ribosomal protein L11 [Candidatus Shikimatogenerans bostrichidophilus]|nr:MAG: 50S ribosomal protein L11 [Candidatus Shikimatogenerans bostrichidophilus]